METVTMHDIRKNPTKFKIIAPVADRDYVHGGGEKNGLVVWRDYPHIIRGAKYIDNFSFVATLKYKGYRRGRSSFLWELTDGVNVFPCSSSKIDELMKMCLAGEVFKGRFTFFKQGQNYSIGLYSSEGE